MAKSNTRKKESNTKKRWTVLVYLAGDNDLDSAGVVDLGEMKQVGSSDQISIVAQFDRAGKNVATKRYLLRKGTALAKDMLATLGETNMGDPNVLRDFLTWGAKTYPAEHYLVVIWNHGAGWDDENIYRSVKRGLKRNVAYKGRAVGETVRAAAGTIPLAHVRAMSKRPLRRALFSTTIHTAARTRAIAFDDQAEDFLDNIELKRVLTAVKKGFGGKIDVLGMDACLMNMAEVAYQVRNTAQVLVGSQEVEPAEGWPYTRILRKLAKTPDMTPRQLGKAIVDRYLASYKPNEGVTQSALDLSASVKLEGEIDKLASALLKEVSGEAGQVAVMRARRAVRSYETKDYIDLVHFCQLLRKFSAGAGVQAACAGVEVTATKNFVLASGFKGASVGNSNGVSIYFPEETISPLYAKLDFAKNNKWNEFLAAYLKSVKQ
jgi:hypothetical protein